MDELILGLVVGSVVALCLGISLRWWDKTGNEKSKTQTQK
jgi:hypothetical protein